MTTPIPGMRLTGARSLRDGALQHRSVVIENGHISKGPLPEVDLSGYLILPGIVDMHGDGFERHLRPRPSAPFPLDHALVATDRELAACGITTAWLAQSWSWEGGHRDPDFAEEFLRGLDDYRHRMQTDLRVQIRCETHTTDTCERLLRAVKVHRVEYVVFNNHLDEVLNLALKDHPEVAAMAKSVGRTPADYIDSVMTARNRASGVPRYLCRLAEAFDRLGVLYGSHDDRDAETRETYSMIGARICEFPLTHSVAKLAHAVNDPVVMGAPNVVRGGSRVGNVAAKDLVATGHCDALVSDYCYPALARAAFHLVDTGVLDLPAAWSLISSRPADIMRLTDRGIIAEGKRADLVVVNETTRDIEATLVAGRITHLTGEAAQRFLHARGQMAMAAE
jgi:alpha-D-ribose 1-methylphosphonate 5-triphosphate diphosphatase